MPGTVAGALRAVGADDPSHGPPGRQGLVVPLPVRRGGRPGAGRMGARARRTGHPGRRVAERDATSSTRSRCSPPMRVAVPDLSTDNELCLRFAALTPVLEQRRPRPRWKSTGVSSQNLRWIRTTLLGRQAGWAVVPAPVGPWRPVRLRPGAPRRGGGEPGAGLRAHRVRTTRRPAWSRVDLEVTGSALARTRPACRPGSRWPGRGAARRVVDEGRVRLAGEVRLDAVERWWPHTHGDQPLYPCPWSSPATDLDLGEVGFRTVEVDRSDGGFDVVVNGRTGLLPRARLVPGRPGGPPGRRRGLESLCRAGPGGRREHAPDPRRDGLRGRPVLRRLRPGRHPGVAGRRCSGRSTPRRTRSSSTPSAAEVTEVLDGAAPAPVAWPWCAAARSSRSSRPCSDCPGSDGTRR